MSWVFCRWFFLFSGWLENPPLEDVFPIENPRMEAKIPTQIGQENPCKSSIFKLHVTFREVGSSTWLDRWGLFMFIENIHQKKVDAKLRLVDTSSKILFLPSARYLLLLLTMSMVCGLDVAMGTLMGCLMTTVFWKVTKSAWSVFFLNWN